MPAWSFLSPFLSIPCSAFSLPHPHRALLSRRSPLPSVFPHACQLKTHTHSRTCTHTRGSLNVQNDTYQSPFLRFIFLLLTHSSRGHTKLQGGEAPTHSSVPTASWPLEILPHRHMRTHVLLLLEDTFQKWAFWFEGHSYIFYFNKKLFSF